MRLASIIIVMFAPILSNCRMPGNTAKTNSLVGLRADVDESVLRGEAPSFLLLQKWFNNELPIDPSKAQIGNVRYKVHNEFTESSFNALPVEFRNQLISYLKQQEERVGEFQANVNNSAKLNQLLKLESDEMADILMALIEPSYSPKTKDLLAHLVAQKSLRSFIDRYSVELLEKLYVRSQRSLVIGMDLERDNFAKILSKTYVGTNGATPQFKSALEADCSKVHDMLEALKSSSGSKCRGSETARLAGVNSVASAAKSMGGASGRAFGIFAGLTAKDGFAARGASSPQLSIFSGRNPNANDPYANGGKVPEANTPNNSPTPNSGGTVNNNNVPTGNNDGPSGGGGVDDLLSMLSGLFGGSMEDDGAWLSGSQGRSASVSLAVPLKPRGLCGGKSGLQLVVCQRYIEGLRPLVRKTNPRTNSSQLALGNSDPSSNGSGYNFYMISEYATKVQNQGSEGACTAFGLAHVLGILGRIQGKSGEYNAWDIWQAQGQEPMTDSAISAAKNMNFDGLKITSSRSVDGSVSSIKRVMDAGRPVYYASDVDSSWDGAGRGNADITCTGSRGVGHAYALVGYDDSTQKFIIKNSWGDYWGDQGYGYLPYSCVGQMNDDGYDIQLK